MFVSMCLAITVSICLLLTVHKYSSVLTVSEGTLPLAARFGHLLWNHTVFIYSEISQKTKVRVRNYISNRLDKEKDT